MSALVFVALALGLAALACAAAATARHITMASKCKDPAFLATFGRRGRR